MDINISTGMVNSVRDEREGQNIRKKIQWHQPGKKVESLSQSPSYINKSVDYLKQLRVKRQHDEASGTIKKRKVIGDQVLDKYLKDNTLTDMQKIEYIKMQAS